MGGQNTKPAAAQATDSKHHSFVSSFFSYAKTKKSNNKTVASTALVLTDKSSGRGHREFNHVMPIDFIDKYFDIQLIIWDYAFDPRWFTLEKPFVFFKSSLEQEILALAYHAAPLDVVEYNVIKANNNLNSHLPMTLVRATIQAIQNLDVTISYRSGKVIAEGMAERLLTLHKNLHPKIFPQSLAQVRRSIPLETKKEEKDTREDLNVTAVNRVFEAIKANDKNTNAEIENFKDFAKNLTQLNRLHLLYVTLNTISDIYDRLTGEFYGSGYRTTAEWKKTSNAISSFEIIVIGLEMGFSPRMQKILKTGIYPILCANSTIERRLDIDGADNAQELRVNSCFDVLRIDWAANVDSRSPIRTEEQEMQMQNLKSSSSFSAFGLMSADTSVKQWTNAYIFMTYYEELYQRYKLMQQSDTESWIDVMKLPGRRSNP